MEADTRPYNRIPDPCYLQNSLPLTGSNISHIHKQTKNHQPEQLFQQTWTFFFFFLPHTSTELVSLQLHQSCVDNTIHDISFKLKQENPQDHLDLEQQFAPLLLVEVLSPPFVCHGHDLVLLLIHSQGEEDSQN